MAVFDSIWDTLGKAPAICKIAASDWQIENSGRASPLYESGPLFAPRDLRYTERS